MVERNIFGKLMLCTVLLPRYDYHSALALVVIIYLEQHISKPFTFGHSMLHVFNGTALRIYKKG